MESQFQLHHIISSLGFESSDKLCDMMWFNHSGQDPPLYGIGLSSLSFEVLPECPCRKSGFESYMGPLRQCNSQTIDCSAKGMLTQDVQHDKLVEFCVTIAEHNLDYAMNHMILEPLKQDSLSEAKVTILVTIFQR